MKTLPDRLREVLWCQKATDEQILKISKGTLFRASIELRMAIEELGRALKEAFSREINWFKKVLK